MASYELNDIENGMSADALYEHALSTYIGEAEAPYRKERYEALLRAAIAKKKGGHRKAMRALAQHLGADEPRGLEAARLYERLALKYGDERAAYEGGYYFYFNARGSEYTIKRAIKLLTIAAEGNVAEAIVIIGEHYMYFEHSDEEGKRLAVRLLKKVESTRLWADFDDTMGRLYSLLGAYLKEGRGTECDPEGAFDAFVMSVRTGDYLTEYDVGECYLTGFGTKKDTEKAFECFMNTKCLAVSKYRIGCCYLRGEGVEKDEAEGVSWLRLAAEEENGDAMYELALCTIEGTGSEKDEELGIELMRRAFDDGASIKAYYYLNKLFPEEYPIED